MSVISKIKDGLELKDWSLIQEALSDLIGTQPAKIIVDKPSYSVPFTKEMISTFSNRPIENNEDDEMNKFVMSTNSNSSSKKERVSKAPFKNKFKDDKTLDPEFIEETPKNLPIKRYRPEIDDSYGFKSVKCSRCSSSLEITIEEFNFKSRDAEGSEFICPSCMKRSAQK